MGGYPTGFAETEGQMILGDFGWTLVILLAFLVGFLVGFWQGRKHEFVETEITF